MKAKDLSGTKFNRVTVIKLLPEKSKHGHRVWLCECKCGKIFNTITSSLCSGRIQSCGCLRLEKTTIHGYARKGSTHPLYPVWRAMINRCENPNCLKYESYGKQGIKICDRWRNSFLLFLQDMGDRPSGTSIDRIDNKLGYFPGNCRWATPIQQANNTKSNVILEFKEQKLTIAQWAKEVNILANTISHRLKAGWTVEKTLTTPVARHK